MRKLLLLAVTLFGSSAALTAPTIHQCVINGVRTFQDTPCPKQAPIEATPLSAVDLATRQKIEIITQRRDALVRELRNLTLQRQQALVRMEQRHLLNDDTSSQQRAQAEAALEADYLQRFNKLRQRVADLDIRLERLQSRP
ncbi:hypothetical protein [Motiliproteus sediminis]|uniref:hypothetical protein n=1 Tax=Motiliproteus sediminis TaxID=1468178 RepID=UPI001AEF9562|nr:hypothetical protein [Motiliproteus sediminis]